MSGVREQSWTRLILPGAGVLAFIALVGANPVLSMLAILALGALWLGALDSPYRTIVAVYLTIQWLQASTKLWIAKAYNIDLSIPQTPLLGAVGRAFYVSPDTGQAILLGLACVVLVSIGSRLFEPKMDAFRAEAQGLLPNNLLIGYLVLLPVSRFAGPYVGEGLAQPLIVLGEFRMVCALMLLFGFINQRRGGMQLLLVVVAELGLGFTGYFSGFKGIIVIMGVGLLMNARNYSRQAAPLLIGALAGALVLGTVWTVIKPAYRAILNQGTTDQVVLISMNERVDAVGRLVGNVNVTSLGDGMLGMASRIAYVDYLADVMERTPKRQPYENGKLWGEAIGHVFAPRLLFPNKAALPSDSERTMLYTGRILASEAQGASISIGYVGESYVDFGALGALAVAFAMGVGMGLLGRLLVSLDRSGRPVLIACFFVVAYFPLQQFEMSNIKLLAGVLWRFIMCGLALRFWPVLEQLFADRGAPRSGTEFQQAEA